jgi:hypothetical protein
MKVKPPAESVMFNRTVICNGLLSLPELGLVAGTRAVLGGGVALLLAERLTKEQRKSVGWTLLLMGVITTIPLGIMVLSKRR